MIERLEAKIDYLAAQMSEHIEREHQNTEELKVSVARLEEKVGFHTKGLTALGTTVVATVSGILTQVFWRLFKHS